MTNGHDNCIGSNDNPRHTKHLIIVPNCDIVAALSLSLQSGPVKSVISVLYLDYRYLHYIVKILLNFYVTLFTRQQYLDFNLCHTLPLKDE